MNIRSEKALCWPGRVLALSFAFFAGCPVLAHLVGTYVSDGKSFAITASIACCFLFLSILAVLRLGIPVRPLLSLRGPHLLLASIAVLFWGHWILLNQLSPSPQSMMRYQVAQSAIWLILPLLLFFMWRTWIEPVMVIRFLIALYGLFIVGLFLRWLLGLGLYQSGRWHAGHSLEAIRCGRYSGMSLWVFATAMLCPTTVVPFQLKLLALVCIPLSLLMMVAANARGPWLSMIVVLLVTGIPLVILIMQRIRNDARVLAAILLAVAGITIFVASQIIGLSSDFNRLFTLTNDGGSAAGRITLVHDHLQLLIDSPLALISGSGYDHGYFYPHNVLVEALSNGGLLSFTLIITMFVLTIYVWLARCPMDDVPSLMIVGLFLLSLAGSEVSGSIAGDLTWYFPLLLMMASDRSAIRTHAPTIEKLQRINTPHHTARI